jgi:molybdopterin/thiamine biosynthesis adenylyltransferase
LSILAAGAVLSEVMNPQALEEDDEPLTARNILTYSFHRRDRVAAIDNESSLEHRAREIGQRPPGAETIDLDGRELVVVGVGALGQWFLLGPAWAGEGLRVVIYDKDPEINLHNVARQPLVCRFVGPNPKAVVVAKELQRLDPQGEYKAVFREIRTPEDFGSLGTAAAVLALPDSDGARAVSGAAALAAGLPFGTAGSSIVGAQSVVCRPDRGACVQCLLGLDGSDSAGAAPASCAVQAGSVVGPNMVGAAINLAEMRRTLSGLPFANVRFSTTGRHGNRLERMVSRPPNCEHVEAALSTEKSGRCACTRSP